MNDFLSFYKLRFNLIEDQTPLKAIFQGKKVDEFVPFSLMRECENISIKTPQDALVFCQKLLMLVLILPFSFLQHDLYLSQIKSLLNKGEREGYWNSFQLPRAFIALSLYLMTGIYEKLDVIQLETGGVLLESGGHTADGSIIKPIESTYLALIWLYLGWANQDEHLLIAGLKLTQFCMNFCDRQGHLFQGLWTRESEYHSSTLYSSLLLLCAVISHLPFTITMPVMQEVWVERLERESCNQIDPLIPLLAMQFHKLVEREFFHHGVFNNCIFHDIDPSLGFMYYDYRTLCFACSACGVNTGLGTIHKRGIDIVSFGPHFYPLFDPDCFGIYRTSNGSREGFKDVMMKREEEGCRFKGCSPLISPLCNDVFEQSFSPVYSGTQWLFFDICAHKENVQFDIRVNKCLQEHPLSFVFFVIADRVKLEGGRVLVPRSLERYQGKVLSLTLEKEGKENVFYPTFEGKMEVIPLEGKTHFWSADFLIAFPLTKTLKVYSWRF